MKIAAHSAYHTNNISSVLYDFHRKQIQLPRHFAVNSFTDNITGTTG